ncbi:MAG: oligosaccharide repeat unit polymerase [Verrucomicrobia bacterium]|nr:oligosaccharide repeat unit polymerase [Verrucomicrobiota bacterium]
MTFRVNTLWWLHPACVAGMLLAATTCLTYVTPDASFRALWDLPKCFEFDYLLQTLLLTGAVVFSSCIGSWLPLLPRKPSEWKEAVPWNLVRLLFNAGFCFCLVGYAVWFAIGLSRGINFAALVAVLKAEGTSVYAMRDYFSKAPGITTMTQFAMAVVVLGIPLGFAKGWRPIRWKMAVLLLFTTVRALFLSERLALLELLIPAAVLYFNLRQLRLDGGRDKLGWLLLSVPVLAPVLAYLFFMVFEYFRSWAYYSQVSQMSLPEFALLRLLGYYITSINNGAILLQDIEHPLPIPYYTLEWLWKFPVVKDFLDYEQVSHFPLIGLGSKLLAAEGNPEFNSPCGLILPVLDFGFTGGVVFYLWTGLILGAAYRLFTQGHIVGLAYYPILLVGLLELPRELYWFNSRVFPTWMLLAPILVAGLHQLRPPATNRAVPPKTIPTS